MLAAASAAQYGTPAPEDLVDAWDCQRWGVPYDGLSLLDQPAGKTQRMNTALNIFDAFDSRQQAIISDMPLGDWSEKHPRAWKIVAHIERLRNDNSS